MKITAIEDEGFDHAVFHTAVAKAQKSPGELSDNDLRHLAVYTDGDVLETIVAKRAAALAKAGAKRWEPTVDELTTAIANVMKDVVAPVRARLSRGESDIGELQAKVDALTTRIAVLENKS